ncbi:MBL fold metallo-hydrolase [Nocardioides sambongensis]|uniref:MBL fold metallo-hydrolase n=1 Tax=Nocardioides sambongensis TaxID=2589074 RepID=UPI00112B963B|nr:MBL fold metallo-hydrolase [Nocardioides sambongensis]
MTVTLSWLGHSTVTIDLPGARLLTDPLLRRRAGPLVRRHPAPRPESWQSPDAVLLSHLHHDHCELSSLRMVPEAAVYSSPRNARWLRRRGVPAAGLPDSSWLPLPCGERVELRQVRADHRHRPMPHRPNDAHGHLIRTPDVTVWAVGDTSLYDEMATVPELLGRRLDVILVPISGWGPRLSAGHLDGPQAARACGLARARWALPVHWGTLHLPGQQQRPRGWMDRPRQEFEEALTELAPDCTPIDLRPGESWSLPG